MQLTDDFFDINDAKEGNTLIVGSKIYGEREDRRKLYKRAVGLDMLEGDGVDIIHNLENGPLRPIYDHVECMSVLEHSKRPWLCAQNIENSMVEGGTLFLSVPFVWRYHGYPDDYFRFTVEGVRSLFENIEWDRINYSASGVCIKRIEGLNIGDFVYFERTEVFGVGRKK